MSSSANCRDVLVAAGIEDLFEARIDGVVAEREHLRGQAGPGHVPGRGAGPRARAGRRGVFEDALAGVAAGRAGNFGFVVGVDRVGQAEHCKKHGADVVVDDLAELLGHGVIKQAAFTVEPWALRETELDLDLLAQTESVFALSNGHLGWRGNLDEGEPHGLPGTYLNGVYEVRPLPYAEAAYGLPESGQTIINVTNGKLIRLFVDDEPFDVRYGELRSHERVLDFRAGVLTRTAEWVSPARQRGPGHLDPAGVVHPARDRGHLLRGGAAGRAGADRRAVRAARERAAAVARRRSAGRRRAGQSAAATSARTPADTAVVLVHSTKAASCASARRWTTWSTGRPTSRVESRAVRGRRPGHRHHGAAARAEAAGDQVRRLRLVRRAGR